MTTRVHKPNLGARCWNGNLQPRVRHLLDDDEFWNQTQTPILVSRVRNPYGFGKRLGGVARGCTFFRILRRGRVPRKDSSVTRRVWISFPSVRTSPRQARPKSAAGLPRYPRVETHGLSQSYRRANFRDSTRFRETSAAAGDRFLSFSLRFQVPAVCEDVQRQPLGGTQAPGLLFGEIRQSLRPLPRILPGVFLWEHSGTGPDGSCVSPP